MSEQLNARQLGIIVVFLILTYLAHMLGQVVQIGGAQLAPSIVVYTLLALLIAPVNGWAVLAIVGVVVGLLTMVATSSPYPLANIPAHLGGFLFASLLAKVRPNRGGAVETGVLATAVVLTTLISWTLFAAGTWFGLRGTEFAARTWERFGITFGTGFWGWWLYGLIGVGIPTLLVGLVLSPVLARLVSLGAGSRGRGQSATPR